MKVLNLVFALIATTSTVALFNNVPVQAAQLPASNLIASTGEVYTYQYSSNGQNVEELFITLNRQNKEAVDSAIESAQAAFNRSKSGSSNYKSELGGILQTLNAQVKANQRQFNMAANNEVRAFKAEYPNMSAQSRKELKAQINRLGMQVKNQLAPLHRDLLIALKNMSN
jgi:hypothetical protein